MARAAGSVRGIAIHTNNLGLWRSSRTTSSGRKRCFGGLGLSWKRGDLLEVSVADLNLGNLALAQDDFDRAEEQA